MDRTLVEYTYVTPEGEKLIKQNKILSGLVSNSFIQRVFARIVSFPLLIVLSPPLLLLQFLRSIFTNDRTIFDMIRTRKRRLEPGLVQRESSLTAVGVCMMRCYGNTVGLCDDPLAQYFLHFELALFLRFGVSLLRHQHSVVNVKDSPLSYLPARTNFFDSIVLNSQPRQVVILGAGYDCRAHRLPSNATTWFEIDIATTQAEKRKIVSNTPQAFTNKNVQYVSVDFSCETISQNLKQNPLFDSKCKETVVLLEGVTYYLTYEELKMTLDDLSSYLSSGFYLAMDVFEDVWSTNENIEKQQFRKGSKESVARVAALGEPFKFGLQTDDTAISVFGKLGFNVLAHLGPREIAQRYSTLPGQKAESYREIPHVILLQKC